MKLYTYLLQQKHSQLMLREMISLPSHVTTEHTSESDHHSVFSCNHTGRRLLERHTPCLLLESYNSHTREINTLLLQSHTVIWGWQISCSCNHIQSAEGDKHPAPEITQYSTERDKQFVPYNHKTVSWESQPPCPCNYTTFSWDKQTPCPCNHTTFRWEGQTICPLQLHNNQLTEPTTVPYAITQQSAERANHRAPCNRTIVSWESQPPCPLQSHNSQLREPTTVPPAITQQSAGVDKHTKPPFNHICRCEGPSPCHILQPYTHKAEEVDHIATSCNHLRYSRQLRKLFALSSPAFT